MDFGLHFEVNFEKKAIKKDVENEQGFGQHLDGQCEEVRYRMGECAGPVSTSKIICKHSKQAFYEVLSNTACAPGGRAPYLNRSAHSAGPGTVYGETEIQGKSLFYPDWFFCFV